MADTPQNPDEPVSTRPPEELPPERDRPRPTSKWKLAAQTTPILTALVAVAGLLFAVHQYRSNSEKDRLAKEVDQRLQLQNQIRTDIEQLLLFTQDESQTVSRAAFLIDDMNTVLNSHVNETQRVFEFFPDYRRSLTRSLVRLVRDDCDFSQPRDVAVANKVIGLWPDYTDYLREEPKALDYILLKYIGAMQSLRDRHPGYFAALKLTGEDGILDVSRPQEQGTNEDVLYDHFIGIANGFRQHIALLESAITNRALQQIADRNRREFQSALCNPAVSERILGRYFLGLPCTSGP